VIEFQGIILEGHLLSNAWPLPVIVMASDLVSIRVPACPLERAKLGMSDSIFRDRYIREVLGGSDCESPMSCYAHFRQILRYASLSRTA
jgi:hypothetical protein